MRERSVEVLGVTAPGLFAPIVMAQSVKVLGMAKLPPARFTEPSKLEGGQQDSQWVSVRGVVRSARLKPGWGRQVLFLGVDAGGRTIEARVLDYARRDFKICRARSYLFAVSAGPFSTTRGGSSG